MDRGNRQQEGRSTSAPAAATSAGAAKVVVGRQADRWAMPAATPTGSLARHPGGQAGRTVGLVAFRPVVAAGERPGAASGTS